MSCPIEARISFRSLRKAAERRSIKLSIDWENMPEEMLQQIEEVRKSLEKTEKGFTRQTVENCTIAMEKDPLLSGAFCWNILTERQTL
jgi:hypothetical protein